MERVKNMYNKDNIIEIIDDHQKEINELEESLKSAIGAAVVSAIKSRLSFLYDNQYRYKLQARAWGLIDFD